jgi:hypothetical protein
LILIRSADLNHPHVRGLQTALLSTIFFAQLLVRMI